MAVTLSDIAKAAGVHVTVVSVVLNNKQYLRVSPERREFIKRLASDMGYQPNVQAVNLRKQKKATVGVFLPPWRDTLLLELIHGLSEAAARCDIPLAFYFGMTIESYDRFIHSMTSAKNSGIISYVPCTDNYQRTLALLEEYLANGGNVISLNTWKFSMRNTISLDFNEAEGGILAAQHLLSKGVASYAVLSQNLEPHIQRHEAFMAKLRESNVSEPVRLRIIDGKENQVPEIQEIIRKLLDQVKRPVGIMTTNPHLATFLLIECSLRKWKLHQDFEMAAYDQPSHYNDLYPVARIIQPFREMGKLAIEKLHQLLTGGEAPQSCILSPTIVNPSDLL